MYPSQEPTRSLPWLHGAVMLAGVVLTVFLVQYAAIPFSDDSADYHVTLRDEFQHN